MMVQTGPMLSVSLPSASLSAQALLDRFSDPHGLGERYSSPLRDSIPR